MARINIEEELFRDPRFRFLDSKLGHFMALGVCAAVFKLAQFYWCKYDPETGACLKSGIPKNVFELSEFPEELMRSGLIEERDGCVFVERSAENFCWLVQKTEAGGAKRVSNKNNNLGLAADERRKAVDERLGASLLLTPYSLLLEQNTSTAKAKAFDEVDLFGDTAPAVQKPPPVGDSAKADHNAKISKFIGVYVSAFQNRYKARPDLSGRRRGQIGALVKGAEDFDELCALVQIFCQSDDAWFRKKMHDIQTFAENIGKVRVMMANGVDAGEVDRLFESQKFEKRLMEAIADDEENVLEDQA